MSQPNTQRRWTEDTRTAFLLALRLTGTAIQAAKEIGRQPAVCYKARQREPAFAAAWDAILTDLRARRAALRRSGRPAVAGADVVPPGQPRRDGMTAVRRRAFLRGLSESGTVDGACRAADVSDTAVYNLRARDADFAAAWDRALRVSAPALEQVAYERAVEGWEEPVFASGKQVGTRWRHSPALLKQMIDKRDKAAALTEDPNALRTRAEDAARAAGGFFGTSATREETNAAIMAKLETIEARLRAERVREAERMMAAGLAP